MVARHSELKARIDLILVRLYSDITMVRSVSVQCQYCQDRLDVFCESTRSAHLLSSDKVEWIYLSFLVGGILCIRTLVHLSTYVKLRIFRNNSKQKYLGLFIFSFRYKLFRQPATFSRYLMVVRIIYSDSQGLIEKTADVLLYL